MFLIRCNHYLWFPIVSFLSVKSLRSGDLMYLETVFSPIRWGTLIAFVRYARLLTYLFESLLHMSVELH